MSIVITGSSGFIGSNFIEMIKFKNYTGIDKSKKKGYTNLRVNLSSKNLYEVLKNKKITHFYHFAGHSNLAYQKNFEKCFKEDFMSLMNIIKFLNLYNKNKIKFFYSSSSYVYQNTINKSLINEEENLNPINSFGFAKYFFEKLILLQYKNSVIFRIASVFGKGFVKHPNLINTMYKSANSDLKIEVWGKGKRKLQFIEVFELINIICKAKNVKPGIYNLGSKGNLTTNQISKIISQSFDRKIRVILLKNKKEGETLPLMSIKKIFKNISIKDNGHLSQKVLKFCKELNNE